MKKDQSDNQDEPTSNNRGIKACISDSIQNESQATSEDLSHDFTDLFPHDQVEDPVEIIRQSYSRVQAVGSATALVAIKKENRLEVANLGDSGFMQIRF